MSVKQMQKALALLIRLPDHHRQQPDLDQFLAGFDLNAFERANLSALAHEREVLKYGRKMRQGRIVYLKESLEVTNRVIDYEQIAELIKAEFEPCYTTNDLRDIYGTFRDFLEHESVMWKQICADAPPYLADLAAFELTEAEAEYTGLSPLSMNTTTHYLAHTELRLLACDYAIDDFVNQVRAQKTEAKVDITPKKMTSYYLFIADSTHDLGFRQFAIDHELFQFIKADLCQKPLSQCPPAYNALVDLGLFVPVEVFLDRRNAC